MSTMSEEEIRRALKAQSVPDHLIERHLEYQRSQGRVTGYVRRADDPPSPPTALTAAGPGADYAAPRVPKAEPEHDEQVTLFAWAAVMEAQHPELHWLFAVPNWIGTRTRHHGAYLKAEGRKPGVPDTILPIRRGRYVGLVIEMKVKPNRPNDAQRKWLLHFEEESWCVNVCYSFEEARDVLLRYLSVPTADQG